MSEEYVLNQLSPKEKIEYEHKVGGTIWIATNKRIIKFKKGLLGGKSLRDLDYKHLVSINLKEKRYYWLLVISAILIIIGLFSQNATFFFLMLIIAVLIGVVAVFHRPSYYHFNAPSIKLEDWKMNDTKTKEGKELIQTIRKHCFFDGKK